MSDLSDFLESNFEFEKIVEKEDAKNKSFITQSTKNWNSRNNGAPFKDQSKLKYNQILFVDFGLGYKPELAYCHPCLLIKYNNQFCTVIPITSGTKQIPTAYHPVTNPGGNKAYYLIPKGDCALGHDSILLIRQLKTISESRIIKIIDQNGLPKNSYDEIRMLAFAEAFPDIAHDYEILKNSGLTQP